MKSLLSLVLLSFAIQSHALDLGKMKDKANKAKAEAQQKAETQKATAEGAADSVKTTATNVLESCASDLQKVEACRGVKEAAKAQACLTSHADQLTMQCKSSLGL